MSVWSAEHAAKLELMERATSMSEPRWRVSRIRSRERDESRSSAAAGKRWVPADESAVGDNETRASRRCAFAAGPRHSGATMVAGMKNESGCRCASHHRTASDTVLY